MRAQESLGGALARFDALVRVGATPKVPFPGLGALASPDLAASVTALLTTLPRKSPGKIMALASSFSVVLLSKHAGVELTTQQLEAVIRGILRIVGLLDDSSLLDSGVSVAAATRTSESLAGPDLPTKTQFLRALSYAVFENGGRCVPLHAELLARLTPLAAGSPRLDDLPEGRVAQRVAWNCLGYLCARGGARCTSLYAPAYSLLVPHFFRLVANPSAPWAAAPVVAPQRLSLTSEAVVALGTVLRAMGYVIAEARTVHVATLSALLSGIRALLFLGTPWGTPGVAPGPALEGSLAIDVHKTRLQALACLSAVAKVSSKQLRSFWPLFVPARRPAPPAPALGDGSLLTLLLHDPSPAVRTSATQTLTQFLESSKVFLAQADDMSSTSAGSFASLARATADILGEVHEALRASLCREASVLLLKEALKCAAVLVSHSPYARLSRADDLLAPLLGICRQFIFGRSHALRVSALAPMVAALSLFPPPLCVERFLAEPPHATDDLLVWREQPTPSQAGAPVSSPAPAASTRALLRRNGRDNLAASGSSLGAGLGDDAMASFPVPELDVSHIPFFNAVVHVLMVSSASDRVYLDLLRLLAPISASHFAFFWGACGDLTPVLLCAGTDPQLIVRTTAARIWEDAAVGSARVLALRGSSALGMVRNLWRDLMSLYLATEFDDEAPEVRASAINCYSAIPEALLSDLSPEQRAAVVTLVLGAIADSSPVVRAAACRALGVFVLFPAFRDDPLLLIDAGAALMGAVRLGADENLAVRNRASWSLANLCDALRLCSLENPRVAAEELSPTLVPELLETALRVSFESEKIRCNAVRALGNLGRFTSLPLLLPRGAVESQRFVATGAPLPDCNLGRVIRTLMANVSGGTVKVRWNACYALGSLIRNPALHTPAACPWTAEVVADLTAVLGSSPNFKIRINSAAALCRVPSRAHYGPHYVKVWTCLLSSLRTLDADAGDADFSEFCHKEALRSVLSQAVTHAALHLDQLSDKASTLPAILAADSMLISAAFRSCAHPKPSEVSASEPLELLQKPHPQTKEQEQEQQFSHLHPPSAYLEVQASKPAVVPDDDETADQEEDSVEQLSLEVLLSGFQAVRDLAGPLLSAEDARALEIVLQNLKMK